MEASSDKWHFCCCQKEGKYTWRSLASLFGLFCYCKQNVKVKLFETSNNKQCHQFVTQSSLLAITVQSKRFWGSPGFWRAIAHPSPPPHAPLSSPSLALFLSPVSCRLPLLPAPRLLLLLPSCLKGSPYFCAQNLVSILVLYLYCWDHFQMSRKVQGNCRNTPLCSS